MNPPNSNPSQASKRTRRTFLKSVGVAGAMLPLLQPSLLRAVSPNSKLMHVCIGGAGMGKSDMMALARHPKFVLYAVCDVDQRNFGNAREVNPNCKTYSDYRELLDKEARQFESANVTIPDHMHAPVTMSLIQNHKHVYCQKPLTHDVYEARQIRLAAEKARIVSQMGIQIHSRIEYRLGVHLIQAGHIGRIKRVYSWSHKNWGGGVRSAASDPVPAELNWDHWIGTAPKRPYVKGEYHQSAWRRWLDFGTGTFGDMGCHIYDPVFEALNVEAPSQVTSHGPPPLKETWPKQAQVHYVFPGSQFTHDTVEVTWFDGGLMPPVDVFKPLGDVRVPDQGSLFVGDDGVMLMPHVAAPRLYPKEKFADVKYPKIQTTDHWSQFVDACLGEGETLAPFSYAGKLTESVLLGGIAVRFPNTLLKWDAQNLKFINHSEANQYVKRTYREGW